MKTRRKRHVDIELYPKTHLNGILQMRTRDRSARAIRKGIGAAIHTFGAAVLFPMIKGRQMVRRGLSNTRLHLHGQGDTMLSEELPYYRPQMNVAVSATSQVYMPMEQTLLPPQTLPRRRGEGTDNASKRTKKSKQTAPKILAYDKDAFIAESDGMAAAATMEHTDVPTDSLSRRRLNSTESKGKNTRKRKRSVPKVVAYDRAVPGAQLSGTAAAMQMEQTLAPPGTGVLPYPRREKTDAKSKGRRGAQAKEKTTRAGHRAFNWRLLAAIAACLALSGLFGWYMFEGRYCVVSVFDDGSLQYVRTKEHTVEKMLLAAALNLTPEDEMSVTLSEKPQEGMVISIMRARTISIDADGQSVTVRLAQGTVADALNLAGITCAADDAVVPAADTPIRTDMNVEVFRAKALHIKTKNKTIEVLLGMGTVGDALTKAGITYDDQDQISPSADTAIAEGMEISFMSVDVKTKTHTEAIAYKTVKKNSSSMYYGTTKVSQAGKNGVRTIVEEVTYEDGVEVSRKTLSNKITQKAVDKIILTGVKPTLNPAIAGLPSGGPTEDMIDYTLVIGQITAYTHTGHRTATGKWPKVGMCAVDPALIPYGTLLYIPGYGYAVAEDTGSGKGSVTSIDVFMDTEAKCVAWGRRRNRTVYILK